MSMSSHPAENGPTLLDLWKAQVRIENVNRHSTVTHYQRPNMTHPQEGGTGGEVSEILFFSAKSKRPPSLIYSMQIIPVCLSIVARRKGVSATRRGGLNWTPISLLVGQPMSSRHKAEPTLAKRSHSKKRQKEYRLEKMGSICIKVPKPPKDSGSFTGIISTSPDRSRIHRKLLPKKVHCD